MSIKISDKYTRKLMSISRADDKTLILHINYIISDTIVKTQTDIKKILTSKNQTGSTLTFKKFDDYLNISIVYLAHYC